MPVTRSRRKVSNPPSSASASVPVESVEAQPPVAEVAPPKRGRKPKAKAEAAAPVSEEPVKNDDALSSVVPAASSASSVVPPVSVSVSVSSSLPAPVQETQPIIPAAIPDSSSFAPSSSPSVPSSAPSTAVASSPSSVRRSVKRSLSPVESPSAKLRRLDPALQRLLSVELERLSTEFQSRIDSFRHSCDGELTSLRFFFNRQLTRLPPRVRQMPVQQFASQFGLDVQSVNLETAVARQKELETFVAQTPSLRTSRKHRELLSLQTPMGVLMSAQRMTRASARKAMMAESKLGDENVNTVNLQAAPVQPLFGGPINTGMLAPATVTRLTRNASRPSVKPAAFETPSNAGRKLRARGAKAEAAPEPNSDLLLTVDRSVAVDLSAPAVEVAKGLSSLPLEERAKIVGKLKNMSENVSKVVAELAER